MKKNAMKITEKRPMPKFARKLATEPITLEKIEISNVL